MADRPTEKVNCKLDELKYKEYSPKTNQPSIFNSSKENDISLITN